MKLLVKLGRADPHHISRCFLRRQQVHPHESKCPAWCQNVLFWERQAWTVVPTCTQKQPTISTLTLYLFLDAFTHKNPQKSTLHVTHYRMLFIALKEPGLGSNFRVRNIQFDTQEWSCGVQGIYCLRQSSHAFLRSDLWSERVKNNIVTYGSFAFLSGEN